MGCQTAPMSVEDMLPKRGLRVAIFGSTQFYGADSQDLCQALGQKLAQRCANEVVLLTGANAVVQEVISRNFHQALGGEARIFHLAPRDFKCPWDFGKVLVAGEDMMERRKILAQSAHVAITVEGGPGTSDEIKNAQAVGVPVLPVARTGGASSSEFASCAKPAHVTDAQWALLSDTSVPVDTTASAIAEMVASML
ncbi:unnamed protein product [Effrenium voratum]|uniref:Uncharacterized protein n=1 Tax=Effrenium voratum TaxID=2562239 RepID=A0AA36MQ69_9DINO|nr:unnamed protein product [Effrenium voratum]CAJ1450356.1 unnamed protein product [Effrenium voratum]